VTPSAKVAEAIRLAGRARAYDFSGQVVGQRSGYFHPLAKAHNRVSLSLEMRASELMAEAIDERVYIYPASAKHAVEARRRAEVLARQAELGAEFAAAYGKPRTWIQVAP
jgi:hypothetical protein